MRSAARAIVVKDNQLLVMKRLKMDKTYYTLIGGGIDSSETPDQAAVREVMEESSISVSSPRLVFVEESGAPYGTQYIYLCDYVSGEPVLSSDSDEAFWTKDGLNTYTPMWLPTEELSEVPFVSPLLRDAIVMGLKFGWPKEPYNFSSKNTTRLT